MDKVIQNIAKSSIKRNPRKTIYIFFAILISTFILVSSNIIFDSMSKTKKLEMEYKYGTYKYIAFEVEDEQEAIQFLETSDYNVVEKYDDILDNNGEIIGSIGNIRQNQKLLLPVHYLEGREPLQKNEIALEKNILEKLGYEIKTNQNITLSTNNGLNEYKVVGILENQAEEIAFKSVSGIVLPQETIIEKFIFFNKDDNLPIEDPNFKIAHNNLGYYFGYNTVKSAIIAATILISSIVLFNSITTLSHEKIKELLLLRAVGGTQNQSVRVILWQVLYASLIAMPLGIILGSIFGYASIKWIEVATHQPQAFMISFLMLVNVILGLMFVIFAVMLIPLGTIYRANLVGSMEAPRKKIRIKKVKQLTPLRLTMRYFRIYKHKNIMFIILLGLCLCVTSETIVKIFTPDNYGYNDTKMNFDCSIVLRKDNLVDQSGVEEYLFKHLNQEQLTILQGYKSILPFENKYDEYQYTTVYQTKCNNDKFIQLVESILDKKYSYKDFKEGKVAIMYLPYAYKGNDSFDSKERTMSAPKKNILKYQSELGYEIIHDDSIKVGDVVDYNGNKIVVGGIVDDEKIGEKIFATIGEYLDYYGLLISDQLQLTNLELNEITYSFNRNNSMDNSEIFHVVSDNIFIRDYPNMTNGYENDFWKLFSRLQIISSALIIGIGIVYQQVTLRVQSRYKEIGTYKSLGMENTQLIKVYLYEGLMIALGCIGVALFYRFISIKVEMVSLDYVYNILNDMYPPFPWVQYIGILIIFMIIILLIYYLPIKKMLKRNIIENIKYSE